LTPTTVLSTEVEVLDVEQVRFPVVDPGCMFQRLTLRTMPIQAGVTGDALVATRTAMRHDSIAVITRRWAVDSAGPGRLSPLASWNGVLLLVHRHVVDF
jgi:hypothetical protein